MGEISTVTPCFTPGTHITTDRGQVPVETLRPGIKVATRDNGLRRIYWIGQRVVPYAELLDVPSLCPIIVRAGALGGGRPFRDMVVSPTHRFLVPKAFGDAMTGEAEPLVAAHLLTSLPGISYASCLGVSYLHILCDQHQVLLADGAWAESFHPDDQILGAMAAAQRREILELFPDVATIGAARRFPAARAVVDREGV
ncbi:MAG: Hint domain-containing protein [Pseudomonadota bacterium]